jgi:DNA polymerase-3 subunit gamma/tau
MSEKALYRKYRPKNFTEVLGQEHVVKVLKGSLEQKNIGHAYLFAGSRGTGKTSLARIFASEIGTKNRDLHEIDAASNRGVDDIRALREEVHILPFESSHKVYIVDEVHMLTKEAFNALLKTLEEPPKHVVFILATTELEKLPDTIISRCQTFTFKKPSVEILKKMLIKVATSEGFEMESSSAELIALLASGSFRDALGYLQQVLSSSDGTKIAPEDVEAVTGAPRSVQLLRLVDAIAEEDLDTSLHVVQELALSGTDMKIVLVLLLRIVRAILLLRAAPSLKSDIQNEFTEEEFTLLGIHATTTKAKINSKLLILLLDAQMRTGTTYTPQLPLEIALIEHLEITE